MKLFNLFVEVIGWLRIMASPLFLGITIGIIIYMIETNAIGISLAIAVTSAGLIVGIVMASRICKKHGTMNFISKLNETNDLDNFRNDLKK